jgi:hypothetical protein
MASNEAGDPLSSIRIPNSNLATAIQADQTVVDPMQLANGPRTRWIDKLVDAAYAKDVDLAGTEF